MFLKLYYKHYFYIPFNDVVNALLRSIGMEGVFQIYVRVHRNIRLHASSQELDLTHLQAYQVDKTQGAKIEHLLKTMSINWDGSELEAKVINLKGLLALIL